MVTTDLSFRGESSSDALGLNRRGMSLVEVLIVSGIMGFLAVVMANLWAHQGQQQAALDRQNQIDQAAQNIYRYLQNPTVVKQSAERVNP